MPRRARIKCESGVYHIILRGANRQEIFHDDEDCLRFIEIIAKYKAQKELKVHGWCIMGNHVHLLIEEGNEEVSITMKRIGISFAWYYNWKYKTTGHLFQDRFKSEGVESNEYLLTALRYIHQNPIKAGLVKNIAEWKWSSCNGYYGNSIYPAALLDSELVLGLFSQDKKNAVKSFREFNEIHNEDKCIEYISKIRLTDEEAKIKINKIVDNNNIGLIKSMNKMERDEILCKLKKIEGISQRQLARILGISPNLIFKSQKLEAKEPSL